jgi:hypothetical protein
MIVKGRPEPGVKVSEKALSELVGQVRTPIDREFNALVAKPRITNTRHHDIGDSAAHTAILVSLFSPLR